MGASRTGNEHYEQMVRRLSRCQMSSARGGVVFPKVGRPLLVVETRPGSHLSGA